MDFMDWQPLNIIKATDFSKHWKKELKKYYWTIRNQISNSAAIPNILVILGDFETIRMLTVLRYFVTIDAF